MFFRSLIASLALAATTALAAPTPAPVNPTSIQFTQGTVTRALALPRGAKPTVVETLTSGQRKFSLGGQWVQFSVNGGAVSSVWVYPVTTCPPIPADAAQDVPCANGAGSWHQTHGWTQSAAPACTLTALPWLPTSPPADACLITPPPPTVCVAGSGHDYQVGPGAGQLASPDLVPFENLQPGDTVRFFYKGSAYRTKFAINAHGTAAAPIRVCGVTGPNGELVDIDGNGATSRRTMNYGRASASASNQSRGIAFVGPRDTEVDVNPPSFVTIGPGLLLHNAHPSHTFTDTNGATQSYQTFGAAIVCDPCHDLTITGNTISDNSQAVWTRSQDGGDARHSTNTVISHNVFSGNGIDSDDHEHTLYIQSFTPLIEFNWFKAMRPNAWGNAIKDRSVGPVVRYNKIESGTFALDFVEAEDYAVDAVADPRYRFTYAYGNIITKDNVWAVHYGGNNGGTETYRKGHLYFWNNTLSMSGDPGEGYVVMFRISTADETVDAWNNSMYCVNGDSWWRGEYYCALRAHDDSMPAAGTLNLGVNWMTQGCGSVCDGTGGHPPGGTLNGAQNIVTGLQPPPFNTTTFAPLGAAMSAGQAQPPAVAAYPVDKQIDANAIPRVRSSTHDLGAVEH